ncbi:helix-turn-helix domain-containing protein [Streptomyces sp. M2CJ-2]|uniref:helix-turn-helix domain-containing protein n=1 Tax=Streptomyces sp. M2CJ-2 TaxID=2803948 RepID=UPI002351E1E0|nr:helix-turn-helix domain-containing protein [Streptomyces sp. M2CJ-2]
MTAQERARREALRMRAAELFAAGASAPEVAGPLQVTPKSAYQWRRAWAAGGPAAPASRGPVGGTANSTRRCAGSWPRCWSRGRSRTAGTRTSGGLAQVHRDGSHCGDRGEAEHAAADQRRSSGGASATRPARMSPMSDSSEAECPRGRRQYAEPSGIGPAAQCPGGAS